MIKIIMIIVMIIIIIIMEYLPNACLKCTAELRGLYRRKKKESGI